MNKLEQVLYEFRMELGRDFYMTDVVNMEDGTSIAGGSINPEYDVEYASAKLTEVMKLTHDVAKKISIGYADFNIITTDQRYAISQFLNDETFFWLVSVNRNATLGSVRMIMKDFTPKIIDCLPKPEEMESLRGKNPEGDKSKRNIWDAGK